MNSVRMSVKHCILLILCCFVGPGLLASCQQSPFQLPTPTTTTTNQPARLPVAKRPLSAKFVGQQVGNGPVRIALLVPQTATGTAGTVGKELANAARIAVRDFGANRIQVIIKDTKGKSAEASLAASQARAEGASIILGPLFSASVSAASGITKPAQLPMIAFSTDTGRASRGTYLLSFTPNDDIRRTLLYGMTQGATRVVALLPQGAYGAIAEKELRKTMDAGSGQVVSVIRYGRDNNAMVTAARSSVLHLANANGIYIPEGGKVPELMLKTIQQSGGVLSGKQVMGSGQWDGINLKSSVLQGAIFAGPNKRNFETFAGRYSATYGKRPTITAALAYDSVSLAAELVRRNAQNPYSFEAIESRNGFNGATGLFRFRSNGQLQRGLAVHRIENGAIRTISPAPANFGRGS